MPIALRSLMLATSLVAIPLTGALAQNDPAGNLGSNESITATTGTADNKAASGLHSADVNAKSPRRRQVVTSRNTPGGTGRAIVPGNSSTVAGDQAATGQQKTGNLNK